MAGRAAPGAQSGVVTGEFIEPTPRVSQSFRVREPAVAAALLAKAERVGRAHVVVDLALPGTFQPEGALRRAADVTQQREAIRQAQRELLATLTGRQTSVYASHATIPALAIQTDAAGLLALLDSPLVRHLH